MRLRNNKLYLEEYEYYPLRDEILEVVLSHMDTNSLLKCRLVNKAWKDEAGKVLRKHKNFRLHLWIPSKHSEWLGLQRLQVYAPSHTQSHRYLYTTHFVSLFRSLAQSNPTFMSSSSVYLNHLDEPEFRKFLQAYGSNIRNLSLHGHQLKFARERKTLDFLSKLLTQWCPNITTLDFLKLGPRSYLRTLLNVKASLNSLFDDRFPHYKLQFENCTTNLTEIKIGGLSSGMSPGFFLCLIESSPKLRKLIFTEVLVYGKHMRLDALFSAKELLECVQKRPNITKRLTEFGWQCKELDAYLIGPHDVLNVLEIVSGMEFSKLNTLRIGSSSYNSGSCERYLHCLLGKVASSLTELVFDGDVYLDGDAEKTSEGLKILFPNLPLLPKLLRLSISSKNAYGINILSFVRSLPKLDELEIHGWETRTPRWRRNFPIPSFFLPGCNLKHNPHRNLKKLVIKPVKIMQCVKGIVQSFPGLTYLRIYINNTYGTVSGPEKEKMVTLKETMDVLRCLDKLEILKLVPHGQYSPKDWVGGMRNLTQMTDLKAFAICDMHKVTSTDFENIQPALLELKGHPLPIYFERCMSCNHRNDKDVELFRFAKQNDINMVSITDPGEGQPRVVGDKCLGTAYDGEGIY